MGLSRSQAKSRLYGFDKPLSTNKKGTERGSVFVARPVLAAGAGSAGLQESLVSQAREHSRISAAAHLMRAGEQFPLPSRSNFHGAFPGRTASRKATDDALRHAVR